MTTINRSGGPSRRARPIPYQLWSADEVADRLRGTLHLLWVDAQALVDNPLGDPTERLCLVYHPSTVRPARDLEHLYLLHGSQVSATSWLSSGALELLDAWMATTGQEFLVVMPDAWSSVGGTQYLNSPAVGNYLSYLSDDVIPEVDDRFPIHDRPRVRHLMGHSSGGLGAYNLITSLPGAFAWVALLAADASFEGVHLSTAHPAQRRLLSTYDGHWSRFDEARPLTGSDPSDDPLADQWMLAHTYSANASPQPLLDEHSGLIDPRVWSQWLQFDPVRRVLGDTEALRLVPHLYIAGGSADDTFSDLGSTALNHQLHQIGVRPTHRILPVPHHVNGFLPDALDDLARTRRQAATGGRL